MVMVTSEMVAPSRGFGVTERFFWHHSNSSDQQANIVKIREVEKRVTKVRRNMMGSRTSRDAGTLCKVTWVALNCCTWYMVLGDRVAFLASLQLIWTPGKHCQNNTDGEGNESLLWEIWLKQGHLGTWACSGNREIERLCWHHSNSSGQQAKLCQNKSEKRGMKKVTRNMTETRTSRDIGTLWKFVWVVHGNIKRAPVKGFWGDRVAFLASLQLIWPTGKHCQNERGGKKGDTS